MLGGHIDHAIGFLGETVPPEAQASLADHLGVHGSQLRAIASGVTESGGQTVSILGALVKAKVPVQAVFMRDDRIIPAQHALNLPFNVATRILPGASHLPHWRDPDAIAKLIS
jgi:pyruvate dehydrogenase E2 component (dihydrolipoamide acetyltransferase)